MIVSVLFLNLPLPLFIVVIGFLTLIAERERKGERGASCIHWLIFFLCALTGDRIRNLGVLRRHSNLLSYLTRASNLPSYLTGARNDCF